MGETKDRSWLGRWFSNFDSSQPVPYSDAGYHRLDDVREPALYSDTTVNRRQTSNQASYAGNNANYDQSGCYGYNTYQMGPLPSSMDYELQMKKKEKKPSVNTIWARFVYWLRYTWHMFKVGLAAAGPGFSAAPMMAPPPMISIVSVESRRRAATEGRVPDVKM